MECFLGLDQRGWVGFMRFLAFCGVVARSGGLDGSGSVVDLQFIVVSNITLSIIDTSSLFKILMLGVRTHKLMQITLR